MISMNKKILVFGAGGLLGTLLVKKLEKKYSVIGTTKSARGEIKNKCDITRKEEILQIVQKVNPDIIIHLAGITGNVECEQNPHKTIKTNIMGTYYILDVIKNIMRKTMLYFPLDLAYIFGVTLAYHYNFSMGVFIYVLSLINKIILGRIQVRHLANSLRLIPIFFIASKFTMFPFLIVASILLIINYILKYVFRIAVRSSNAYDTLPFHIANYIISLTFITLLNTVITFMPLIVS